MLTLSRLSKRYANGVKALDGVDLSIGTGLFGLLGPNGAGKSTLMRTLATLQEPDEGEIRFDGCDVLAEPQRLRRQLGYLPQDFGVYPGVPAVRLLDHLAVLKGLTHRGERAEQVDALLQLTNLYEVRKKDVSTFSGGMKQRFGIAQALLGSPRLLIVDEPTAGLDPEERNRFHNLLSEVGENVVVILSTHIVEDVRDLCSKMAILAGGRVLLEGEPERLVEQLEGRVWRKTVSKAAVAEHRAAHAVISTHLYGGKTRIHVLADTCPDSGFERVPPDLEDVYFSALPGQPSRAERVAC
ncbi:ABC transporter ATP-binding protein [Archangium violaceum]|uniref:ABC transporter ATP-binding protein n=1 Tax=Archangium violaceum TaxID=83451 RepID=UPI0036DD6B9E